MSVVRIRPRAPFLHLHPARRLLRQFVLVDSGAGKRGIDRGEDAAARFGRTGQILMFIKARSMWEHCRKTDFETYASLVSPVALAPLRLLDLWRVAESIPRKFPR